ncbi:MAG: NPCBM/NEW2 domain-containing protein, partial [Planctomycetes bacterium]|nr:NPCBM/NEW2 domain-containing protein [Planctomycetota bacterium]
LLPFIEASKWWGDGDPLAAGRWAIATFFGLSLMLFNLLLMGERMRWRWIWLVLFLLMPSQFFGRHAFVRAISPSLGFMLLIIFLMFRRRYLLTGVAIGLYNHLYLGAVLFSPVLVGCYVVAILLGPRGWRRIPTSLIVFSVTGWLTGVLTHPYLDGMMEFLRLQVLGSGLSPDIPVGREWSPYNDLWWFARMAGPLMIIWAAALCLRVRMGPTFNAKELALTFLNFGFLVLTMKAKRFIEYWPAFCLLSAAYMSAPLVNRLASWFDSPEDTSSGLSLHWWKTGLIVVLAEVAVAAACLIPGRAGAYIDGFVVEWRLWALVAGMYILAPLAAIWTRQTSQEEDPLARWLGMVAIPICTALMIGVTAAILLFGVGISDEALPRFSLGLLSGGLLGLIVLGVALLARRAGSGSSNWSIGCCIQKTGVTLVAGIGVVSAAVALGALPLAARQRDVNSKYDRPAVRAAMDYLKTNSQPGDVVFTDDWDIFPVFFYYNSHNYYIVGLDPKFTQEREPELWERYVKVSRGQLPSSVEVTLTDDEGKPVRKRIRVELEDIREHFRARFVVTDRDHKSLARKLANADNFAELIYPAAPYKVCHNDPYLIFRVLDPGERVADTASVDDEDDNVLYLSSLDPETVQQGWGELMLDRTVEGGPIRIGSSIYQRGLGTHTPLTLEYAIPEGYDAFEAYVGIDHDTDGNGSAIISVDLDGREVFKSPVVTGISDAIVLQIPLDGAKRLTLRADPTGDGDKYDHVDWASARFVRAKNGD